MPQECHGALRSMPIVPQTKSMRPMYSVPVLKMRKLEDTMLKDPPEIGEVKIQSLV